jgi:hypothetical protein
VAKEIGITKVKYSAKRRGLAALTATLVVGAALVSVASAPAEAATQRCRAQSTSIPLPNQGKGIMSVALDVCVASRGNERNAFVRHIWWETTRYNNKLFKYWRIVIRLERKGVTRSSHRCDFTWHANNVVRPGNNTPSTCSAGKISTSLRGGWTGDGYLEYDRIDDGKGRRTWQFVGTPAIN